MTEMNWRTAAVPVACMIMCLFAQVLWLSSGLAAAAGSHGIGARGLFQSRIGAIGVLPFVPEANACSFSAVHACLSLFARRVS